MRKDEGYKISCFGFGKNRSEITKLDVSWKKLEGDLDLVGFVNLKELCCSDNEFTTVEFLNSLPHPEKLEKLWIYNNNIQPTDIAVFSKFIN